MGASSISAAIGLRHQWTEASRAASFACFSCMLPVLITFYRHRSCATRGRASEDVCPVNVPTATDPSTSPGIYTSMVLVSLDFW